MWPPAGLFFVMSDLRDMLADDFSDGGVFFPTDSDDNPTGFNELVTFYPKYDRTQKQTLNVKVNRNALVGTREVRGDGVVLNHRNGRRTRQSITIKVLAAVSVMQSQPSTNPDAFLVDGQIWFVKRIVKQTAYSKTLLCVQAGDSEIRNYERVG